jgi:heat shock protein HslJ
MRRLLANLLFLALVPAGAIAQSDNAAGWTLISVGGVAAVDGGRIAFSADGAVFGTTGCNRFNGQVVASPGLLNFNTRFAVTRMACDGPLGEQETSVFKALRGSVAVAFDPVADRMMMIPTNGAPVLGFTRAD